MQLGDCIHHNGVLAHETCEAGVRYVDVRVIRANKPHAWPCMVRQMGGGKQPRNCAQYCGATADDVARDDAEIETILARADAGLCPQCGATCISNETSNVVTLLCPLHGIVSRGCKRVEESYYESESQ